jgi:methylase of polypeptide subunit release factors
LPGKDTATITGESCACPTPDAPTRKAVVLDCFAGTGTSVAVANHLGRYGIGIDLSADYLKLARWRCQDPGLRAKVLRVDKPAAEVPGQMALL